MIPLPNLNWLANNSISENIKRIEFEKSLEYLIKKESKIILNDNKN